MRSFWGDVYTCTLQALCLLPSEESYLVLSDSAIFIYIVSEGINLPSTEQSPERVEYNHKVPSLRNIGIRSFTHVHSLGLKRD
jgi:hypothetical protein